MSSYAEANRAAWDERAAVHARSRFYDLARFVSDPDHISDIVRVDQPYLGDLTGQRVVHLQCHIGTDTLSLARLGARVTGLDSSGASIAEARRLFEATGTSGRFETADVYDAAAALGETYGLVYTGVGALNWLPDIAAWARVVSALLGPGGRLYVRDAHPMLYTLDDTTDGTLRVRYPYFETVEPVPYDGDQEGISYADDDGAAPQQHVTHEWNHGLGELVTAVLDAGLTVTTLHEHRGCHWEALPHMVVEDGLYRLPVEQRDLVPLMFTLVARRP